MLESPRRVEKPWGYELIWAETDEYAGKILHVTAGKHFPCNTTKLRMKPFFYWKGSCFSKLDYP